MYPSSDGQYRGYRDRVIEGGASGASGADIPQEEWEADGEMPCLL